MAAITSSVVTLLRSWEQAAKGGYTVEKVKDLKIVLSTQGGTAGDIPASALGLSKIYSAVAQGLNVSGTQKGAVVGIATDGSEIFPVDMNQATDANRTLRANVTGDLYVRVTGM